jgi:hypothetical protein
MCEFHFDEGLSPEENIEQFFEHLRSVDPDLTSLLEAHIDLMLPLPGDRQSRSTSRTAFNRAIDEALHDSQSGAQETLE